MDRLFLHSGVFSAADIFSCVRAAHGRYLVNNMKYLIKTQRCIEPVRPKFRVLQTLPLCLALAVAAVAVSVPAAAQEAAAPNVGLINPASAAFNATTGKAYIVDANRGSVSVTDDATGETTEVKAGTGPVSIAVDTANGRAYVVNADDGTVSVLDGKTDAVIATLQVGDHPYSIVADSAAGKIYVTRTYSDQLMIIDAATNEITSVKAGSPDLLVVNPRTHTLYLLGYEGGNLKTLDGATHALTETTVGMHAWDMALNEATGALYVARPNNAEVAVLEPGASTFKRIPTGQIPCSVGVNPRTNTIYVVNYADNSITAIDSSKGLAIATIAVGKRPEAIAVDTKHNRVYVANTQGNSVTVIDGETNGVLATVDAGIAPYAMAIDPQRGKLHVANLGQHSHTVLDVSHIEASHRANSK